MPDTAAYLYLGLAVTAVIVAAQIISMVARQRGLKRDWAMLDDLEDSEHAR
ncbi:MAG TPA: hypothetical protein PKX07_15340 [Aggregatilineales bacterium]|jgi:hypothetical protein|nr:hypothetical protein [Aggregatilineales bacterium]